MLFDLPSDEALYAALIARDTGYDGRAWVGVTSTGVFCRLSCPARKPKAENCQWFSAPAACLSAGFRPCKRCNPLMTRADPVMTELLTALDADPTHRWSEGDLVKRGFDPSTVRRAFKRNLGVTFLDLARQRRLAEGFTTLQGGARVIDAQVAAGFDSPSAFRDAFTRWLGVAPSSLPNAAHLQAHWFQTSLGPMIAVADKHSLHLLEFTDRKALPRELQRLHKATPIGLGPFDIHRRVEIQISEFLKGERPVFNLPLTLHGSAFVKDTWRLLRTIKAGETRTYGALAEMLGRPGAARAVARANGANQIAIVIPCHRVIGADGSLTGYGGGLWRKDRLIALEKSFAEKDSS
ncbi:MAG: trifunctional transcriptional activator/DNA repair protein Ada/methylated-DNA--[protein]-cysteine S-methyltransferase [Pseudomonadota bacterium]